MLSFPNVASTGHVLLVDDSPLALASVGGLLRDSGLEVTGVSSGTEALALAMAREQPFDLFILDVMMPDMSGHDLTRALRSHPATAHVPILIFTSLDSTSDQVAGLEAGADDFIPKSVPNEEMLARVRSFISLGQMRSHVLAQREAMAQFQFDSPVPTDARTRLVVLHPSREDGERFALQLRTQLAAGFGSLEAKVPTGNVQADTSQADVVIATWEVALGSEGLLKRFGVQETAPSVIVLDDAETPARRVRAFEQGADDYLVTLRPAAELAARVAGALRRHQRHSHLRRARDRAVLAAVTDPLTGLYNRAFFQESLHVEVLRSRRYGRPLSLLLLDVDHFKLVNDALGHAAGDRALHEVAARLRKTARATDVIARYGGEEFAVLLPETSHANALVAGERIRAAVAGTPVVGRAGTRTLTISIGVGSCPDNATDAEKLFEEVDVALYAAKAAGRDRVIGASGDRPGVPAQSQRPVAASELVDRLRALLSEDLESPLGSARAAAKLLRDGTPPEDPLYGATARLLEASAETRLALKQLLEDLLKYLAQSR